MVNASDFEPTVPLPAGLDVVAIRRAIEYVERELGDLIEIYHEQANVFSALVGMFGTKALDSVSSYEKHRHAVTAQQRFPDLKNVLRENRAERTLRDNTCRVSQEYFKAVEESVTVRPSLSPWRLALGGGTCSEDLFCAARGRQIQAHDTH
jgi:hypothetical protein